MAKNSSKPRFEYLAIIVLVVIAVFLGVNIYKQSKHQTPKTANTNSAAQNFSPIPNQASGSGQLQVKFPDYLTADEKKVLQTPAQNASDAEKKSHFELAQKLVQTGNTLDITNCYGKPIVLGTKEKETITVTNNGTEDKTMMINTDHTYKVPAKSSTTVTVDFGHGPGLYGYGCSSVSGAAGIILVAPAQ